MSQPQAPTAPSPQLPPVADRAALLWTVYGTPVAVEELVALAQAQFGLRAVANSTRRIYVNHDHTTLLEVMALPGAAAHDALIAQLILNLPGPAQQTWAQLWQHLNESGLLTGFRERAAALHPPTELIQTPMPSEHLWGCTLVYQAVLTSPTAELDAALEQLSTQAAWLPAGLTQAVALARANLPGGAIWLLDLPLPAPAQAAVLPVTIYAALFTAEQNESLGRSYLYGPSADLLIPDLIAHKAYYHIRQYQRPTWLTAYKQAVWRVRQHAATLLAQPHSAVSTPEFTALKATYVNLLSATSLLDTLRSSLEEQRTNWEAWAIPDVLQPLLDRHHKHLATAISHLNLLEASGRNAVEMTRTALEIVQTEHEKGEQQREQTIATWLTFAGVVLAVPQLITAEVATNVILEGMLYPLLHNIGYTPPALATLAPAAHIGIALLVQIGCILLTLFALRLWLRRSR